MRYISSAERIGMMAERVAALDFLGVDLLAELVEVAGAQGGDFVLGGGEVVLQLRDLAQGTKNGYKISLSATSLHTLRGPKNAQERQELCASLPDPGILRQLFRS